MLPTHVRPVAAGRRAPHAEAQRSHRSGQECRGPPWPRAAASFLGGTQWKGPPCPDHFPRVAAANTGRGAGPSVPPSRLARKPSIIAGAGPTCRDDRFQQMEVGTVAATLSPSALARLRDLEELYRARWQESPTFACRAPGRVNLIGEHIDYHRFSVLPVAIEGDVCNACTRACGPRLPRR